MMWLGIISLLISISSIVISIWFYSAKIREKRKYFSRLIKFLHNMDYKNYAYEAKEIQSFTVANGVEWSERIKNPKHRDKNQVTLYSKDRVAKFENSAVLNYLPVSSGFHFYKPINENSIIIHIVNSVGEKSSAVLHLANLNDDDHERFKSVIAKPPTKA